MVVVRMPSLLSKNLNTLPVLHALLTEGSVVGAARRVGLSQPTVCGILAKLRIEFGDPLLVRVGRGMHLTTRAERLLPVVTALCTDLELLYEPEDFDPARLDRLFVIAAPDHLAFLLTPSLLTLIRAEAPDVRLRFVDASFDLDTHLLDDTVDAAICANFDAWPRLRYRRLFSERIVVAVWKDHPLASRSRVTTADIRRYPSSMMDARAAESAHRPRVATGVPIIDSSHTISLSQFTDSVLLTVGTDFVAPAPEALVRRLGEHLPVVAVALAEPDTIEGGVFWAPAREHDAHQVWLRSLIERATAGLG